MKTFTSNRFRMLISIAVLLCTTFSSWASTYVPKIIAGVVKADSWTIGNNKEGIYQLKLNDDPQLEQLNTDRDVFLAPLGGAVYDNDTMYGIHFKQEWDPYEQANTYIIYNVAYDMKTWTRTKGQALSNTYGNLISSCGITHDPVTGKNFGIFYNFNMSYQVINRKLATIDFVDTEVSGAPKKEVIGIVETPFAAIAAAENGFLYGVGKDGYLYIIDKTMVEEQPCVNVYPIGDLGIEDISDNPSSMCFDPRTKKLYWSYVSNTMKSYLYEIKYNLGMVSATKLMQLPDNAYFVNMYIAPMEAADDAPAAVSNLTADFADEQTTGTVSFTLPSLTYGGDALTGELDYTVYADGVSVATGKAAAGSQVQQSVTVASDGRMVELKVTATNSVGEGAPEKLKLYIGRDVPTAVTNVKLSYNLVTKKTNLSWTAPLVGENGKTLTAANLCYNIMRCPDSVMVATQQPAITSFSEAIADDGDLTSYYYVVTPVNGVHVGASAESNHVLIGQALQPPFREDFTTKAGFDRFVVVDGNNDGKKWERYHKYYEYTGTTVDHAKMDAHREHADDDHLLTPLLKLTKGSRYELKFTAKKEYGDRKYDQQLRVLLAQQDKESVLVSDTILIDDVNFNVFFTEIVPQEDGIYQIDFHAISPANSASLLIDEVSLSASMLSISPDSVTHIVITPNVAGELKATARFIAPTMNLHGDQLERISRIDITDKYDKVVGTIANPTPGQQCEVEMTNLEAGVNTYYFVAWLDENRGMKAEVTAFIGQDRPLPPTNVTLKAEGETAVLTWVAPTLGVNNLPVNAEALKYNLYTLDEQGYAHLYKSNISSPYDTKVKTAEGEQQLLYYVIDAETTGGLSELVASNGIVIGAPYSLPYRDGFDGANQQFVWLEGDYADWNLGVTSDISSDSDGKSLAFIPHRADYAFFNLGKLSLAGVEKPTLSFDYYAIPATTTATLGIAVDCAPQGNSTTLQQIDFQKETEMKWKQVSIDLSQFKNEPYVIVKFSMVSLMDVTEQVPIVIDNLQIDDESALSIRTVPSQNNRGEGIYRLDGTRVEKNDLKKGIYIVGGRKTVVK